MVETPGGLPKISKVTWNPAAGAEARKQVEAEMQQAFQDQLAVARAADPTHQRLVKLEEQVKKLTSKLKKIESSEVTTDE